MPTATVTYSVQSNQTQPTVVSGTNNQPVVHQINPAILNITYVDQNGVDQHVTNFSSTAGSWNLTFTGTVGQPMAVSAVEIEQYPPLGVTVVATSSNGSQTLTATNVGRASVTVGQQIFPGTTIPAGVTGTI
jgi:hypothetical protein